MESLVSDYTGGNILENQGLGIPVVCLFLLKLRFLILNRRQSSKTGKANSSDWRFSLQLRTCDLGFNISGTGSSELSEIVVLDP